MKTVKKILYGAIMALSAVCFAFADAAPEPEPMPNDYIPMVSYMVVAGIAIIIIIAIIVIIHSIRKRRKSGK